MLNNVVLVGRLTRDPETRFIQGTGTQVVRMTIAVQRDYKNRDGSTTTDFIPIEAMGKQAEFCSNYLRKGRLISVQGSLRIDRYETPEGESRTATKVSARLVHALEGRKAVHDDSPYVPEEEASESRNAKAYKQEPMQEAMTEEQLKNIGSGFNTSVKGFSAIDDDDVPF